MTFAALSAKAAGYDVYAVIDSSGTWSKLVQETAVARMAAAGVHIMSWFAVTCELQGDWRNPTGEGLANLLGTRLPFYGNLISSKNYKPEEEAKNKTDSKDSAKSENRKRL